MQKILRSGSCWCRCVFFLRKWGFTMQYYRRAMASMCCTDKPVFWCMSVSAEVVEQHRYGWTSCCRWWSTTCRRVHFLQAGRVQGARSCLWIVGTVSHVLIRAYVAQEKETCALVLVGCFWLFNLENRLSAVSSFCIWPHLVALPQVALGPFLSRQRHGEPRPRCC